MFIQYITFLSKYSSKISGFTPTGNPPEIHLVRLDDFREMQRMHPNFAALLGGTGTNQRWQGGDFDSQAFDPRIFRDGDISPICVLTLTLSS